MFLSPQSAHRNPEDVEYPGRQLEPGCIRLVRLMPGKWNDTIRCEILESNLAHAEYLALSYVWGSKHQKRYIDLNNGVFPVTVNLESALRHLREQLKSDYQGVLIWVDALCINQPDDGERTNQVRMMRSIYERCQCVMVYLGDRLEGKVRRHEHPVVLHFEPGEPIPVLATGNHGDVAAYRVFCLLQELVDAKHLSEVTMLSLEPVHKLDGGHAGKEDSERMLLVEALRKMTQPPFTPWWSRIWTVQEVAVAKRVAVVYGTMSAPWSLFARAAGNYIQHSTSCCSHSAARLPTDQAKVLKDCFNRILGIEELQVRMARRTTRKSHSGWSLLDLLRKFRDRRVTDPRDKIYALLSLVATSNALPGIVPDYTLSEIDVFCQATLTCIHWHKNLSIFNTELGRKFRDDLPSWVPDWGAPGGSFYEARATATELYSICPSTQPANVDTVQPLNGRALRLGGSAWEPITYVGDIQWGGDVREIWRDTLLSWWIDVASFDGISSTNDRRDFWKLICGDVISKSSAGNDARRATGHDEITFVAWALESNMSPEMLKYETAWSEDARVWRDFHLLWPDPGDYVPSSRLDSVPHLRSEMIRNCLAYWNLSQGIGRIGPYEAPDAITERLFAEERWLFASGSPRGDAPWDQMYHGIKQYLDRHHHLSPNVKYHRELLPVIDTSIMTATLSRRLIKTTNHVGLGPANAKVGDVIFLLGGGKTPFVLRETAAELTIPGPTFEIIGDCYLQGIMDWKQRPLRHEDIWQTITLV